MLNRLAIFLRLTRPLFLLGGVLIYLLGAAAAWRAGYPLNLFSLAIGQALVTATQLMAHYANEYFDQESDALNMNRTWFSGGSGIFASGSLQPRAALRAAQACLGVAIIATLVAAVRTPVILLIGGAAILASWFYSAPPLRLVSSGYGEVAASLVVTGLTPLAGFVLQSGGRLSLNVLIIGLSLGCLHLAMLIGFDIPDYQADRQAKKGTLAVRLGLARAAWVHDLAIGAGLAILLGYILWGVREARFLWLALIPALWQMASVFAYIDEKPHRYGWLTFGSLALFAIASALWLAGFVL